MSLPLTPGFATVALFARFCKGAVSGKVPDIFSQSQVFSRSPMVSSDQGARFISAMNKATQSALQLAQ